MLTDAFGNLRKVGILVDIQPNFLPIDLRLDTEQLRVGPALHSLAEFMLTDAWVLTDILW